MGIMEIFRRKSKSRSVPDEILELADQLTVGQMIPITVTTPEEESSPVLSFLIKETDRSIKKLHNQKIEIIPGCIRFEAEEEIFALYLVIKLEGSDQYSYETAFSLSEENMVKDCGMFANQDILQIIFVGEKETNFVVAKIEHIGLHFGAIMNHVLESSKCEWPINKFMNCIEIIKEHTVNPAGLFSLLQKNDGFLTVNLKS